MDEKIRTELALFRFSLIAPMVNGSLDGSIKNYLEQICAKQYDVPGYGMREFSPSTIKHWFYEYQRYGLDGLKKHRRNDQGSFRNLSSEAQSFIKEAIKVAPRRSGVDIYSDLVNAKIHPIVSLSTVGRFIRHLKNGLEEPAVERRRYELEFANDCWQSDTCTGQYLLIDGKKKRTYLIAILDDASRLITHSQFFFEENYLALESTLRQALAKRGIPKKLFVDNGKIFHSQQLRLICARLGIALSHTRCYSPASKGKIERYFKTYRQQFLSQLDNQQITSLEQLNQLNANYVEKIYNQRIHSSLQGLTPMERFLKDQQQLRVVTLTHLDKTFLHEVNRTVTKDATVSIQRKVFEVPQIYCGHKVVILYSPYDLSSVYLKHPAENDLVTVYPIRLIDNSTIVRKQNQRDPIDYTQILQGGNS